MQFYTDYFKVLMTTKTSGYKEWKKKYKKALDSVLMWKKAEKELKSSKGLSDASIKFLADEAIEKEMDKDMCKMNERMDEF